MRVTDHHDMTLAVEVALNLNITNQPVVTSILSSFFIAHSVAYRTWEQEVVG